MQVDYEKLFPVLKTIPEIEVLINPFISAYENDAMEQLEGQVASAKIGMAELPPRNYTMCYPEMILPSILITPKNPRSCAWR